MDRNKTDYIFLQTQEMFPQLEASVIFMVLSENNFKLDEALPSLAILSQTVEDASHQKNDVYQLTQSFPQLDGAQSLFHKPSVPNQRGPNKKLHKTKHKPSNKKRKKEKTHPEKEISEPFSDLSSGYLPFYEELYDTTQIFDAGKQILPHGIFSHFETSLSPASAPSPPNLSDITTSNVADSLQPLENFVPMISSTKSEETVQAVSLINGSINGNEQGVRDPIVIDKNVEGEKAVSTETLNLSSGFTNHFDDSKDEFSAEKDAALFSKPSKTPKEISCEISSLSTTNKCEASKKFLLLQSYLSVGLVNGKRFVYSGKSELKEETTKPYHSFQDRSSFTNKKVLANTEKSSKNNNDKFRQQPSRSFSAAPSNSKDRGVKLNALAQPFNFKNSQNAAPKPKLVAAAQVPGDLHGIQDVIIDDKSLSVASSIGSPLSGSTPLSWSRSQRQNEDPIKFLTHFQATSAKTVNKSPKVSTYNPPHPQRVSSLQNPLPFCPPTFKDSLSGLFQAPSNGHGIGTNGGDSPCTNDFAKSQKDSHSASWNNFNPKTSFNLFQNKTPYTSQHFGTNKTHLPSNQTNGLAASARTNSPENRRKHSNSPDITKWLFIIRGLPGSGKSTLAKQLANGQGFILSTDDYFMTPKGYFIDFTLLSQAHEWNIQRAKDCMLKGSSPIIIDNTNTSSWEMKPYMRMAVEYGYKIKIREPNTSWKFKASELARRNVHGVTKEKIKLMLERYEKDVTIKGVLGEELYRQYETKCLKLPHRTIELDAKVTDKIQNALLSDDDNILLKLKPAEGNSAEKMPSSISDDTSLSENIKEVLNQTTESKKMEKNEIITEKLACKDIAKPVTFTPSKGNSPKSESGIMEQTSCSEDVSEPSPNISPKPNADTASETKTKLISLAPRFEKETLSSQIQIAGDEWSSFMQRIKGDKSNSTDSKIPTPSAPNRNNASTCTDDAYFALLSKLDSDIDVITDDVVLDANSCAFQPETIVKLIKLKKPMYEKSTSTDDLEVENTHDSDLETLRMLFPDYSLEDLNHIYTTCDKKLDWATDVIADSSLYGARNTVADFDNEPCTSMSLDAYYDSEYAGESSEAVRTNKENGQVEVKPAVNDTGSLTLHLPSQFLLHLVTLFGDEKDKVDDHALEIDTDLAFAIYNAWKASKLRNQSRVSDNHSASSSQRGQVPDDVKRRDQMKRDEELARRIQREEKMLSSNKVRTPPSNRKKNKRNPIRSLFSPNESDSSPVSGKWSIDRVDRPPTLSQIMQEESAAAESEKRQATKFEKMKLTSQMKREELHAMYHSISPALLDEIFAANNYNLEETMFAVNCVFCEDDDLCFKTFTVSNSLEPHLAQRRKNDKPLNPNASWEPPDSSKNRLLTFDDVHSDLYATYDEIRTEANLQRTQMHECQRKAALANHQKKGALAYYYAQLAYEHQKRLREANQRAAAITYKRMNEGRSPNDLDLHGLHVDEAIDTLRSVLDQLQNERTGPRHLTVITGRGLNSADGIPKIKKAVLEWLKNKQIQYESLNDGCVKITW